ncbi:MAG: hypothetical protein GY754_14525 [bacterium]|nr:hypothetical protein [bacterium]
MALEIKKISHAVIISDIHLGWALCGTAHERLLNCLPEIAGESELVILNGDIVDYFRSAYNKKGARTIEAFKKLIQTWKKAGKQVVYIEGNHDRKEIADKNFSPDCLSYDFTGHNGETIRIFHGHRSGTETYRPGPYDRYGSKLLKLDNLVLSKLPFLKKALPFLVGWIYGIIGFIEDKLWQKGLRKRLHELSRDVEVLVHGHIHFGARKYTINNKPVYRSGSWVSGGQVGTTNSLLRYTKGKFERIKITATGWKTC